MSCLEEIYAAQQGRSRQTVISLSAALQDELCMAVALLPLTVIDMRLQPSARLVASDASSTAEAAVSAEVGHSSPPKLNAMLYKRDFGIAW